MKLYFDFLTYEFVQIGLLFVKIVKHSTVDSLQQKPIYRKWKKNFQVENFTNDVETVVDICMREIFPYVLFMFDIDPHDQWMSVW